MRWILRILIVLLLCLMLLPLMANAETQGGTWGTLTWTIDDEGMLEISGSGAMNSFYYSSTAARLEHKNIIKEVRVKDGVTSISQYAFHNCTNLTSITIPNSVINIGNGAFRGCSRLSNITIPDCVTSIGVATFYDCSSLTNVYLPKSVTSIGDSAFDGCSSLTDIAIPEGVTTIGTTFFYRCIALTNVIIPKSVISIGAWAFRNCSSLSTITIPEGVKNISDQAFKDCAALRYAPVGSEGAKALGKARYSFRDNCYPKIDMQYVYSNNEEISDFQIVDADLDIQEVVSPVDVTSIGSEAFSFCYYYFGK